MSKLEAAKQATRNLKAAAPIGDVDALGTASTEQPAPKAKRERKPRDPNAAPRVPKTIESELAKIRAKYEPELQRDREALHALDLKRAELAERLRGNEARMGRILSVLAADAPAPEPAQDPAYGDNKPENEPGAAPAEPAPDPRFAPPPVIAPAGDTPAGDPNNQ